MTITIPPALRDAVDEDDFPQRLEWLAALPDVIAGIARAWELRLGAPYLPGGQCAWVAPAQDRAGNALALKVGWRHREAEHEADALAFWAGEGAVRCLAAQTLPDTTVLLLERCVPGAQLAQATPEAEQDVVIAGLLTRLWARPPATGHPFGSLSEMCDNWARNVDIAIELSTASFDAGLAHAGAQALRELARDAGREVLLCTDLHAGNVLSATRAPWLVIDPKPFVGDPAYDLVQHMLNCEERLAADPVGLATRMAQLADVDPRRVARWLFARCAQESMYAPGLTGVARRLAP